MRFKSLSKDQRERFKELYLAGYSFSLIFEKLGCYDADDRGSGKYEVLGRAYRKRLGLEPEETLSQSSIGVKSLLN